MERTYLDLWKHWLLEAAELSDGDITIKTGEDPKDPDYHNIWISNKKTKTTYVWMVYADPDMKLVPDIRIDVESIDESTKEMTYRYNHPINGWKGSTNKINDTDWNKVKTNYEATVPDTKINFVRSTWKQDGKTVKANYVVYLKFKKKFKY